MDRIKEEREKKNQQILKQSPSADFEMKVNQDTKLEYFPCSIVQKPNAKEDDIDEMKVFHEVYGTPDSKINEESLIGDLKNQDMKMLYCITMYNENFGQFLQSLGGVIRSIIELINNDKYTLKAEQFGVVLICDGIDKVDKEFMARLEEFNLFDPEICCNTVLKTDINDEHVKRYFQKKSTPVEEDEREGERIERNDDNRHDYATHNVSHIFSNKLKEEQIVRMFDVKDKDEDYECNFHNGSNNWSPSQWIKEKKEKGIKKRDRGKGSDGYEIPDINMFFCAKHENKGKIESHLWFFKGFCSYLNPDYCQMIDIGTVPLKESISTICLYMDKFTDVGGAAGEIEVFEPTSKELGFPKTKKSSTGGEPKIINRSCFEKMEAFVLVRAQYVEYKMSHYIDKCFESLFGFVSVLPGAFSTFRWEAIKGDPLRSFFKGLEGDKHTAKEANMYLAEDRIMCLEILRKYSGNWVLRYIPGCRALTDPPTTVVDLIKQRRRWTNGSLFASWYVLDHLHLITRSSHSCCRKCSLFVLYIYMMMNFVFSLLLVGSLFSTYSIFVRSFFDQGDDDDCSSFKPARVLEICYVSILFIFTLMSITKPIEKSTLSNRFMVLLFGVFVLAALGFGLKYFWDEQKGEFSGYLLLITLFGSYLVPYVLNFRKIRFFWYLLGVMFLIFLSPMYINIFIIYSMANLHDVSWGSRDTDSKKGDETRKNLEKFRALSLIVWIFLNSAYAYGIIYISEDNGDIYIIVLTVLVSGSVILRLLMAIVHRFYDLYSQCKLKCVRRKDREDQIEENQPERNQHEEFVEESKE